LEKQILSLMTERDHLKRSIPELQVSYSKSQAELMKAQAELDTARDAHCAEIKSLRDQVDSEKRSADAQSERALNSQHHADTAWAEHAKAANRAIHAEKQRDALNDKIKELEESVSQTTLQNNNLRSRLNEAVSKLVTLKQQDGSAARDLLALIQDLVRDPDNTKTLQRAGEVLHAAQSEAGAA
jgi:chromosome segregation ATPase